MRKRIRQFKKKTVGKLAKTKVKALIKKIVLLNNSQQMCILSIWKTFQKNKKINNNRYN